MRCAKIFFNFGDVN